MAEYKMAEYTDSFTSTMMSQIDDELMCGVCLELYNTPTILPCGHNFCKQCIDGIIRNVSYTFLTLGAPTAFKCPVCKARVYYNDVASLPINRSLESIVRLYKESQPVDIFDKSWHTDMNMSASHCSEHNCPMDQYCEGCALAICVTCAMLKHNGHDIRKLSEVTSSVQVELTDILSDLKKQMLPVNKHLHAMEQLLSDNKESEEAVLKHLDSQITALTNALKSRRNDLAHELSLQNQSLQKPVRAEIQRCRSLKESTNQIMNKLSILRRTNPNRKIQLLQRTCAELKTVVANDFKEFFECHEKPDPVRLSWKIDTMGVTKAISDVTWRKPEELDVKDVEDQTDSKNNSRSSQHPELLHRSNTPVPVSSSLKSPEGNAGDGLPFSQAFPLGRDVMTPCNGQGNKSEAQEQTASTENSVSSIKNGDPGTEVQVNNSPRLLSTGTDPTGGASNVPNESAPNKAGSANSSTLSLPECGHSPEVMKTRVLHTPPKSQNAEALAKFVARRKTMSPSIASPTVTVGKPVEDVNTHSGHKPPIQETNQADDISEPRPMKSVKQKYNKNSSAVSTRDLNTNTSVNNKGTEKALPHKDNTIIEPAAKIQAAPLEVDDETKAGDDSRTDFQTSVREKTCNKGAVGAISAATNGADADSGVSSRTVKTEVVPKFTKQPLAVNLDFNLSSSDNKPAKPKNDTFV